MDIEMVKYLNLYNQSLIQKNAKKTIISNLCGLQAQFLSNAYHALKIRCDIENSVDSWGDDLVKTWANRGTVHVITIEDIGLYRTTNSNWCLNSWAPSNRISSKRKEYFADIILDSIKSGVTMREDIKRRCFNFGMTQIESEAVFDQWGGVLRELAEKGKICYKVTQKKEFMISPNFVPIEPEKAQIIKAHRYFSHYGPATIKDAAYFFGTTQKNIKEFLKELPYKECKVNNKDYFYIEREYDLKNEQPKCVFLAGFDPLMLGYQKKESLFLPEEYMRYIFNLSGIVMPSILYDGIVIGKWKREKNRIMIAAFKQLCSKEQREIEECAYNLWGENIQVQY